MAFQVPPLPYAFDALEPHIDAKTMEIHHDKHHGAYVANANAAIEKHPELASKTVEDLLWGINQVPEDIRTVIRNNAGGHATFGSYDAFKEQLQKTGVGQFGSGWAWLVVDRAGKLSVKGYPNQDSPYMEEMTPIFGVDVWEHAYYLKYQNRRADYITAWWNTLNWDAINQRFSSVWA
jgi:Fe-Mn family superoxide dismutase